MCSRDLLFYVNAFVFTYDPRRSPSVIPFVTWPFQDQALLKLDDAIGNHDLAIEKSRDMGATWMCLLPIEWRWHFGFYQTFLLISRKEEYVDKSSDPKSLFWKLDFVHKWQPRWLLPGKTRTKLHLSNTDNGSTIDGESTTGDVARGDRRTAILLDEFASFEDGYQALSATADASNCRIFNSTPKGVGNAFYNVIESGTEKIRLHWSEHPYKGRDLYKDEAGRLRSPWYDNECKRRHHPREIAQELDIDYLGSDDTFFDGVVLDAVQANQVRRPFWQGRIEYQTDSLKPIKFVETKHGPLKLWMHPDERGQAPTHRNFVMGIDVASGSKDSTGRGASNSVASVGDRLTGEKVAELVMNGVDPKVFAAECVALARWLKGPDNQGAYLCWEANGPGRLFGDAIIDREYRNFFWRQNERSVSKKLMDIPGWWATRESKLALLGDYRQALAEGKFQNRSFQAVRECRMYVYAKSGAVDHSAALNAADPSEGRENHGDRVIADALCWKAIKSMGVTEDKRRDKLSEIGTFFARREAARQKEQDQDSGTMDW